jgi:hypothetical protein
MLDHPAQFLLGIGLILALLAWRLRARVIRKKSAARLPAWRVLGQGLLEIFAALVLIVITAEATRFVEINFCVELWEGSNWCNHGVPDSAPGNSGHD